MNDTQRMHWPITLFLFFFLHSERIFSLYVILHIRNAFPFRYEDWKRIYTEFVGVLRGKPKKDQKDTTSPTRTLSWSLHWKGYRHSHTAPLEFAALGIRNTPDRRGQDNHHHRSVEMYSQSWPP